MLLSVDLSQAELRVMAILSDDDWMIAALQEGAGDFFDTHMMPVCFPTVNLTKLDAVEKKELRTQVKTVQYGLAFGRQAKAIAVELGLSVADAQTIINNYFATAPKFATWRMQVMYAATHSSHRDFLTSPFGRKFQAEVVTNRNANNLQREALSFLPQSTASDICLVTAIRIHEQVKKMGGHIVALVHDAIVVEVKNKFTRDLPTTRMICDDIGNMIKSELRATGEAVMGTKVPFLSEYTVGTKWGEL